MWSQLAKQGPVDRLFGADADTSAQQSVVQTGTATEEAAATQEVAAIEELPKTAPKPAAKKEPK